jgi:hypothetical protein
MGGVSDTSALADQQFAGNSYNNCSMLRYTDNYNKRHAEKMTTNTDAVNKNINLSHSDWSILWRMEFMGVQHVLGHHQIRKM